MAQQCFWKMSVAILYKVGCEGKKVGRPVMNLLHLTLRQDTSTWTKVVGGNQGDISSSFLFTPFFLYSRTLILFRNPYLREDDPIPGSGVYSDQSNLIIIFLYTLAMIGYKTQFGSMRCEEKSVKKLQGKISSFLPDTHKEMPSALSAHCGV